MLSAAGTTTPKKTDTPKRSAKMAQAQSLNHLLNFTLPPRQTQQNLYIPRRARRTGTHHSVWNKERFINAQYRFVMNPSGDYTVHFADPDIYFGWNDILQIIVPRGQSLMSSGEQTSQEGGVLSCPICLAAPTAPRMTKCGHIFCFPCILHLLSTSDQPKWVRCPICFDSVNERQLKAVKWLDDITSTDELEDGPAEGSSSSHTLDHNPGTTLRMRLIQRPQITTLALPRSSTWPSDLLPPHQAPFHFLPDVFSFAKFMLATPAYLEAQLNNDLADLAMERRLLSGMQDDLGIAFVDAADAKVRHQIEKARALDTPHIREMAETARHLAQKLSAQLPDDRRRTPSSQVTPIQDAPQEFLATQGVGFNAFTPAAAPQDPTPTPSPRSSTPSRNPRQRRNLNPPPPSTSTYFFYQAASGLPIFLHPLDIKILFSHFNSYAAFPDTITVRVESHTESTVNDDLRKRCKYLSHFPEGADLVFVEADLAGVVGAEGLKNFEGPLRQRRAKRKEKGRKDDKARARAEEREKEKIAQTWGAYRSLPAATPDHVLAREPSPSPPAPEPETQVPQSTGVWGPRSFASAAHAAQGRAPGQRAVPVRRDNREPEQDEWDLDVAFHELEQRNRSGGGRRGTRMVVLGGGGGRRGR